MPNSAHHIRTLSVRHFRGIEALELTGLQAVNLIVGQNNVGKTSVLEAIALAANPQLLESLAGLLHGHAGFRHPGMESTGAFFDPQFYDWLIRDGEEGGTATIQATGQAVENSLVMKKLAASDSIPVSQPIAQTPKFCGFAAPGSTALRVSVVAATPVPPQRLVASLANALRKRNGEAMMHAVLAKVDPRIQRVRVDPTPEGNIVAIDIGLSEMIPLSQAGQGIGRLVHMLSELIGENAQVCIIDEIENGLHHTALKDIWRGIAEISQTLGVQVFATTHSNECLQAAHAVFHDEDPNHEHEFAVIQLMRVRDQITGKVMNEERVDDALAANIELR
jgi:AAA domain, putative AbiEii toxin, Type IV TA system